MTGDTDTDAVLITTVLLALIFTGFALGSVRLPTVLIMWLTHAVLVPWLVILEYDRMSISIQVGFLSILFAMIELAFWSATVVRKKPNPYEDWKP